MVAKMVNLRTDRWIWAACLTLFYCVSAEVDAQRVILFEDFQSTASDARPASANFYARSCVQFINCATDPATIVVTGGAFPDPFGAGNKSLVFHNPNSGAQMAITWTAAFNDDPAMFRNGTIEFDVWMDKPLPPLGQQGGKFWSFLDIRTGYGGTDRSGVTTVGDVTVWDNIRVQNIFGQAEPVEQVVDAAGQFTVGLQTVYNDPVPAGLFAPNQSFHVKLEFNGTAGNESYVIKVNDTPITWMMDGQTSHPWVPNAPGINVLSFLTDASAFFSGGASNVYLDNLKVVNNDLPPAAAVGDYNNNGTVDAADYVVWQNSENTNTVLPNDPIGGTIGAAQYNQWRANFGVTAGSGATAASGSVPEPAGLVLFVGTLAVAAGACRRRLNAR